MMAKAKKSAKKAPSSSRGFSARPKLVGPGKQITTPAVTALRAPPSFP